MALPLAANTTCDIYRFGNTPPAAPDVAGVPGHLHADYAKGLDAGEGTIEEPFKFTHGLRVARDVDVRDAYDAGTPGLHYDTIYGPDQSGTPFTVVFVERRQRGTAQDHLKVYVRRGAPTWPTDEV